MRERICQGGRRAQLGPGGEVCERRSARPGRRGSPRADGSPGRASARPPRIGKRLPVPGADSSWLTEKSEVKDGAPPAPRCRRGTRIAGPGHGGVAGPAAVAAGLRVPRALLGTYLAAPAPRPRGPAGEGGAAGGDPAVRSTGGAVSLRVHPCPSCRSERGCRAAGAVAILPRRPRPCGAEGQCRAQRRLAAGSDGALAVP